MIITVVMIALAMLPASAVQREWTGGPLGGSWSDPGNWDPTGVPQNGDDLLFDSFSGGLMFNDLTNLTVRTLDFRSGAWQLSGNILNVSGPIGNGGSSLVEIHCDIRLEAGTRFSAFSSSPPSNPSLRLTGAIDLNGYALRLLARSDCTVELSGAISGNGSITVFVETVDYFTAGTVKFSGTAGNTFTGPVTLDSQQSSCCAFVVGSHLVLDKQSGLAVPGALIAGTNCDVRLDRPHQIADNAAVSLGPGASLLLQGNTETIGSLGMAGSFTGQSYGKSIVDSGGATLSVGGNITADNRTNHIYNDVPLIKGKLGLPPGNHNITATGNQFYGLNIEAQILGDGGFTKNGSAALALQGSNIFNGNLTVSAGTVVARHANALGSAAGVTHLTNSGSLSLDNVAIYDKILSVRGNSPFSSETFGSGLIAYGTNLWAGPVILETNLVVTLEAVSFAGPIVGPGGLDCRSSIVELSGTDANTFTGALLVHNPLLRLNKSSGVAAFGGPLIVGGGGSASRKEVRWMQDYQRLFADVTIFTNGLVNLNDHREDFGPITFYGGNYNDGGSIWTGTGSLGIYGLVTVNEADALDTATIYGQVGLPSGYHEFRVNAPYNPLHGLRIFASITGPGHIRKTGYGSLDLVGSNSYGGLTIVDEGMLWALNPSALGASNPGTTVNDGGTLALVSSMPEQISIRGTGVPFLGFNYGALYAYADVQLRNPFPSIYSCIDVTTNATIRIETGASLTADGFISGTGTLTKTGGGALVFSNANANAYSGDTIISEGSLELRKPNNTIAVPGNLLLGPATTTIGAWWFQSGAMNANASVTVNANSLLDLNGFDQTLLGLNLNDGGDVQTGAGRLNIAPGGVVQVGSLSQSGSHTSSSISGNLGLPANNFIAFNVAPYAIFPPFTFEPELEVPAIISVNGFESPSLEPAGFSKQSLGWMRLLANNTYKGEAFISGGTLQVEGSQPQSSARLANGGRLQGSGTVGHVYFQGSSGVIAPGASPGILTTSNFNAGGSGNGMLQVELNGTTVGSGYDQVNVRGTVTLSGTTLNGLLNFPSAINDQFTIINNDGADAVIGTFNGLPQNASLHIGGELFTVSYTGGTGNDVVLSRIATPPKPVLTIDPIPPSLVRLRWPTNDPAYRLEFNTNLAGATWTPAFPLPVIMGTNFVVTNATSGTVSSSTVTPLAWYRLGENDPGAATGLAVTNTTTDSAGSNHLKQYGSPLYTSLVSTDAAAQVASTLGVLLNGSSQYLSNALVTTAVNNFGIEAWVKPITTSSAYQFVAYNGNTANNGWGIVWQDGFFQGWFGNVILFGAGVVTPGTWAHVALVRDNGSSTLYVNGVAANIPTGFSPITPTSGFALGIRPQTPTTDFFNGAIDEVRVFTLVPGQFSTNDLLLHRASTVTTVPPAKFYRLAKP